MRHLFIWLIIIFSIIIAILGVSLHANALKTIVNIINFFNFMLPILAVGALVNYLWKSCHSDRKDD